MGCGEEGGQPALAWLRGRCWHCPGCQGHAGRAQGHAPLADACPEQGDMDLGQEAVHCTWYEVRTHGVCSVSCLFMQCRCAVKLCGRAECVGDVGCTKCEMCVCSDTG